MTLNDLLVKHEIDPRTVLVLRHRPREKELRKVLPWLAADRPDLFNAYQQTQGAKVEGAMKKAKYVASFIGHAPKLSLYIGLYKVSSWDPLSMKQYLQRAAIRELNEHGMISSFLEDERTSILWFNLDLQKFYHEWKGKLVVQWPGKELSWWRWADRNTFPIHAIAEDSQLVSTMPKWYEINVSWSDLGIFPSHWKAALAQWRGIYYIFDEVDGKGYVGSAYGDANLLGRWLNYAESGDGGNKLLKSRDPSNFQFTILQRVSPDLEPREVIAIEESWKQRLHSFAPFGLNIN